MVKAKFLFILLGSLLLAYSLSVQAAKTASKKNTTCKVKDELDEEGNPYPKGYYQVQQNINITFATKPSKTPLILNASQVKPRTVYVEDEPSNPEYFKIKVFDEDGVQIIPDPKSGDNQKAFYYIKCKEFYLVKKEEEKDIDFVERQHREGPIPSDYIVEDPTYTSKIISGLEEMVRTFLPTKQDTSCTTCDEEPEATKDDHNTRLNFIETKSSDQLVPYFNCYRSTTAAHTAYVKKYQPSLRRISTIIHKILVNEIQIPDIKQQDVEAVLSCLVFRESSHWQGIESDTGAVGLGQYTDPGISKVITILSKISDYKEGFDYVTEMDKVAKTYEVNHAKNIADKTALEEKLRELVKKTTLSEQEKQKQKKQIADKVLALDNSMYKINDEFEKATATLDTQQATNEKVKGTKPLWEEFWEDPNISKRFKKPNLKKIDNWKSPPASLMTNKAFLENNNNYEIIVLFTGLTWLEDLLDLLTTIKAINMYKKIQVAEQASGVEIMIGAASMYNLGVYGFKSKALTFLNHQTNKSDWDPRFDGWIKNLKNAKTKQSAEGINHLLSIKRCSEANKNQPPCGGSTSRAEPPCKPRTLHAPLNRSACKNDKMHLCVNKKLKGYECTEK